MTKHPGGRGRKAPTKYVQTNVSLPPHLRALLDSWVTPDVSRSELVAQLIEERATRLQAASEVRVALPQVVERSDWLHEGAELVATGKAAATATQDVLLKHLASEGRLVFSESQWEIHFFNRKSIKVLRSTVEKMISSNTLKLKNS